MCYNYEAMIRSTIKRSIHDVGYEEAMSSLTEAEKTIWEEKGKRLSESLSGESSTGENDAEKQSAFPGAEVQVIPITTGVREYYHFGFLADWATSLKDQRINFNARADSIRIKPTWKKAWNNKQRCLVCASGFYETDKQTKKRYYFSVKGKEEIFFAGIFNHWIDKSTGEITKTFAIITTEPNQLVEPVHNRMPVILDREGEMTWLKPNATEEAVYQLLRPFPAELMDMKESPKLPGKKKAGPELDFDS